jgi:small subunit ribosomal protein S1
MDDDGELDVEVGDIVQALVVRTAGGLVLSHRLARGAASRQQLADAYRAGLPVEGKVARAIKGGYEVKVAGQRTFCPLSQIGTGYTEDPSVHEGKVYTFRITELGEGGKNLVVSRRALLEEEAREQEEEVRRSIVPGADLVGRVASVRPFGAFVDLGGGVQGLVHVSEMGWSRVTDPSTIVEQGQEVTVRVLAVDRERNKISLGLKQHLADPWAGVADTYEVGHFVLGRVSRLAEFGAFVELEPGVEGLAHASTFPASGDRSAWKKGIAPGQEVAVEILEVDTDKRRIAVAVVHGEELRDATEYAQRRKKEETERPQGLGSMADQLRAAIERKKKD